MKTRLIASFVLVLAAVTVMLSGEAVIIAAITILNMLSVYELCKSYGFCKRDTWFVPLYIEVLVFLVEGTCWGLH